jgi:hypothetical protein
MLGAALCSAPVALRAQVTRALPHPAAELVIPREITRGSPLLAALASLVVPGMGQAIMNQQRWVAYAGAELAGWLIEIDRLRTGRHAQAAYRDLAWTVTRGMADLRANADWEYYEAVGSWSSSGAYDLDPERGGLQPETDRQTFNGDLWQEAREIYVLVPEARGDPDAYAKALSYYELKAVRPRFAWDWTSSADSRARYRRLFRQSNDALRTASLVLSGVLANHLFSMADAFVSSTLPGDAPIRVSSGWRSLPTGPVFTWSVELRH